MPLNTSNLKKGAAIVIAVCPKHIRNGLKTLYLPHVNKVDEKAAG
ncbi:hypothetical protein [Metabacillus arenae]|nr:hypothetical protein [Metabacillus arenae]